jgi:predicted transcriptional regulator
MRTVVGIRSGVSAHPGDSSMGLTPIIWFASWRQLAGLLSGENRALLRLIRDSQSRTLQELAERSVRAASNFSRTLRNLERHRLVRLHRSPDTRAVRPEALTAKFLVILD